MKSLSRTLAWFLFTGFALLVWPAPAFSQETPKKPAIKQGATPQTPPSSGVVMFREYCAACHGPRGEGNGPAAASLKKPPANLSTLSARNGGTFPQKRVEDVLRYGVDYPSAHGTSDMPVWGPTFRALGGGDGDIVSLRIANLVNYLRQLQAKK